MFSDDGNFVKYGCSANFTGGADSLYDYDLDDDDQKDEVGAQAVRGRHRSDRENNYLEWPPKRCRTEKERWVKVTVIAFFLLMRMSLF